MPWVTFVAALWLFATAPAIALLLRVFFARPPARLGTQPLPRIFPELALRHSMPPKRHRPIPRLNGLPNFGLVLHIAYLAPLIMYSIMPFRERLYGFYVSLEPPRHILSESHVPEKTLGVYVDAKRRFFLSGEPIERENLERRLKQQLNTRLAWVVYFEADENSLYMDAAYTIDAIQGLGAKAIWITPKMRAEIEESRRRLR